MSIIQIPLRLTSGAFILNSGLGKRKLGEEQAAYLQNMAAKGVPSLAKLSPSQFKNFITATEIGTGAALLAPFVPGWLAGSALTAFSGGLMSMYLNTPEMTEADGVRPSQDGTAVAKDVFLLGAGLAVTADSVVNRPGKRKKAAKKRAARISDARDAKVDAIRAAQDEKVAAIHEAREQQVAALREARQELAKLRKKA
ncbi:MULTISPECIES: hypothetical protein [Micrococcus]|uniref:hypothetical protein n=1 Tax=Micrococcus TaxID=1269 RepID=UPI001CCA1C83|nr:MULTISPECIES: hypothetical protein [Micrococcus]MCG7423309.1 hypothetical protein [Micrococcus sp. ACRRV]UBH25489.1 hypothetical protein KW076_04685 [Micrococcus porci]